MTHTDIGSFFVLVADPPDVMIGGLPKLKREEDDRTHGGPNRYACENNDCTNHGVFRVCEASAPTQLLLSDYRQRKPAGASSMAATYDRPMHSADSTV
jgi:hypothetical protein